MNERIIAHGYSSAQFLFQNNLITETIIRTCTMFSAEFIWKKTQGKKEYVERMMTF